MSQAQPIPTPGLPPENRTTANVTSPYSAAAATRPFQRDWFMPTILSGVQDRAVHDGLARFTLGLSPTGLAGAYRALRP
ncbi:MAG: hypothetical protein ACI8XZ_004348 [Gammaproteobacteria bacterium]|jgi:hypothetical protein